MLFRILRIKLWNKLSLILTQYLALALSVSYYQNHYSGYLFAIPGFNDAERRSQINAQARCSRNGSTLLSITDSNTQNAVVAFIKDSIAQIQMTGNNIITDGIRQNGDWTWINGAKTTLQVQEQNEGLRPSYAYLNTTSSGLALVADKPTEGKNYYICEDSNITYNQWSAGHPIYYDNQNCLCLLPNTPTFDWKWSECQCSQPYQFVCISSQAKTTLPLTSLKPLPNSSSITTSSSSNFNFQSSLHSNTISTQRTPEGSSPNVCSAFGGDSCLSVGLGVGLGIGFPALLTILILAGFLIRQTRRLRKYESSSAAVKSESEVTKPTPTYESLDQSRSDQSQDPYSSLAKTET